MTQMFSKDEIINKHGKSIYYFSKNSGNNDLENFKKSFIYSESNKEYIIVGKNDTLTCITRYNDSSDYEVCGYYLMIFNSNGELIEDTFDNWKLDDDSIGSVEMVLDELNLI